MILIHDLDTHTTHGTAKMLYNVKAIQNDFSTRKKLFSQVIIGTKHIHSNNFHSTSDSSIVSKKVISDDSLCSTFKNSDDTEIIKILCNETHLSFCKGIFVPRHNLRKARKIRLKVKVIELANDSWSWNRQLMSNIGHGSFFNQLLSNLLVDDTRYLVIFLDERGFSDHHFRALIALKTAFSKEDSSRHTSRFKVRNLRRFLKVIFLH